MGKRKNIKKLQRQLEELEEEKAQTRNYLLWGALVLICTAIVVSGDTTPGGYWSPTQPAQSHPLMYLGGNHHNHNDS
jgi:hypothetical protein